MTVRPLKRSLRLRGWQIPAAVGYLGTALFWLLIAAGTILCLTAVVLAVLVTISYLWQQL